MSSLLDVRDLSAGYGDIEVLRGVSFTVADAAITALIGSNGAGKSTTMRAVAGLLPAKAGQIDLAGRDLTRVPASQRVEAGLALVPEGRLVFPEFTVDETLQIGAFCVRARDGMAVRLEEMYALFPRLRERRRTQAGALSGGEQQMLAIARGLMSAPRLLLLDEPSLGLAPLVVTHLFETIVAIAKRGIAVCLVEQDVHRSLEVADYGYVLENGAITTHGPARELLQSDHVRTIYLGL